MKKINIALSLLMAVGVLSLSTVKTFAASTTMPNGTVVIGSKALSLEYSNDVKNLAEVTSDIVLGGEVYVKNFNGQWVDNLTGNVVSSTIIPAVIYKDDNNISTAYKIGDILDTAQSDTFDIISIN